MKVKCEISYCEKFSKYRNLAGVYICDLHFSEVQGNLQKQGLTLTKENVLKVVEQMGETYYKGTPAPVKAKVPEKPPEVVISESAPDITEIEHSETIAEVSEITETKDIATEEPESLPDSN